MNLKTIESTFRLGALLGIVCLWAASCSTPKNVAYFQDAAQLSGMALQAEQQLRLRTEDGGECGFHAGSQRETADDGLVGLLGRASDGGLYRRRTGDD